MARAGAKESFAETAEDLAVFADLKVDAKDVERIAENTGRVIEAGCKSVIGRRLKQSGMFWSLAGANAIIAPRCCFSSGRFEQFWEDTA